MVADVGRSTLNRVVGMASFISLSFMAAIPAAAFDTTTCFTKNAPGDSIVRACSLAIASGNFKGRELAELYYQRGAVRLGENDYAIADYTEAIRLDPTFEIAYYNRGLAYQAKGDLEHAISDYNEALRLGVKVGQQFYVSRGTAYRTKGDLDRAIADFTEAIRLDPKDGRAIINRASVYGQKGDFGHAIADYDEAIQLDPKRAIAYYGRGNAYRLKGDLARAASDYDEAIQLDPKNAYFYFSRGRLYLYTSIAKALADFKQANELNPKDPVLALWLDFVERRNNSPSHLAQIAQTLDMTAWPAPIVRLFLGETTPAVVLAAANAADPMTKQKQVCDSNFFVGEFELLQNAKQEGIRLLQIAARDCPPDRIASSAANDELKALGAAEKGR